MTEPLGDADQALLLGWAIPYKLPTRQRAEGDQVFGLGIFALMALGAVGFLIMDEHVGVGASLAVLGSLVFAVMIFWAILPVLLGLRKPHHLPLTPPPDQSGRVTRVGRRPHGGRGRAGPAAGPRVHGHLSARPG